MTAWGSGELYALVRRARSVLPSQHRALLDHIGVQEAVVQVWPEGVQDLYLTLQQPSPVRRELAGALALWLEELRVVAFNAPALKQATDGLSDDDRYLAVARLAWHEYGHALSFKQSTPEQRRRGPDLLALLPARMQATIDYPNGYRCAQVFDEVIAVVYAVLIPRVYGSVRNDDYGCPAFLHSDVFEAFKEVIPWRPSR